MKMTNLVLDPEKSGFTQFLLTDVKPWYNYKNGKRTDEKLGTTCEVALPQHQLDKISVHIAGEISLKPRLQQVAFKNLEISLYPNFSNPSEAGIKAQAESVREVK